MIIRVNTVEVCDARDDDHNNTARKTKCIKINVECR